MPGSITLNTANGLPAANITWTEPTATDNSGLQTLTSTHSPGSTFSIGVVTVQYRAVDPYGNNVIETFTVTINGMGYKFVT